MSADCLFCSIRDGKVPATMLASSDLSLAFADINPAAPTHALVIPRRHVANAAELAAFPEELADVLSLGAQVAQEAGLDGDYRLVFNTGAGAGQTVFHAHLHVIGGRSLTWPPG